MLLTDRTRTKEQAQEESNKPSIAKMTPKNDIQYAICDRALLKCARYWGYGEQNIEQVGMLIYINGSLFLLLYDSCYWRLSCMTNYIRYDGKRTKERHSVEKAGRTKD
jgi:hypothetical protein